MSEEEFNCLLEKGSSTFSICDIQLLKSYASSYKDKLLQKENIIKEIYAKANDTNITSLDLREYILDNLGGNK